MVERSRSFRIPGAETTDLRIALYERKEVVERLQDELNAEREASATSASEALSMILRLQGEKAELAMEAGQYKRMVEEQMSHAEMSFALLEDLIYEKEIEITALEYQVEAYRSQLLSLGCSDVTSLDDKLQVNCYEDDHMKMNDLSLCDRSQTPSPQFVTDLSIPEEKEVIEQSLNSGRHEEKHSLDMYWEQIKKLDEQMKELTEFRDSVQCKASVSESVLIKGEEDFASSSNFQEDTQRNEEAKDLLKTDETMVIKVSKQTKMEKKSPNRQTRDRSGKRNRAEYQAELQRLRLRVERLERGKIKTESETSGVLNQEEISLVNEMKEELSSLQSSEVKSLNTMDNLQPWIDPAIVSIQESKIGVLDTDFLGLPWILWFIWKARNEKVYKNSIQSAPIILGKARKEYKVWLSSITQAETDQISRQTIASRIHKSPVYAPFFCFFDGSWKTEDITTGIGSILKLQDGTNDFLGMQRTYRGLSALHMEVRSFLWAMANLVDNHRFYSQFVTDSTDLVRLISEPYGWPAFDAEIKEYQDLRQHYLEFELIYQPREKNVQADAFAKEAHRRSKIFSFINTSIPFWVKDTLHIF